MKGHFHRALLFSLFLLCCSSKIFAQEAKEAFFRPVHYLLGPLHTVEAGMRGGFQRAKLWDIFQYTHDIVSKDWWHYRGKMEEKGLVFSAVYTGDYVAVMDGGKKQGAMYLGDLDLTLELDTERAGLWKGGKVFLYLVNNHGGQPTAKYIGDLQTADNIEAPRENSIRMLELWYQQSFFEDRFSALVGQHDMNSEFFVTENGSLFINSSFGLNPEVSTNVPTSVYPFTTLGVVSKIKPCQFFEGRLEFMMGLRAMP